MSDYTQEIYGDLLLQYEETQLENVKLRILVRELAEMLDDCLFSSDGEVWVRAGKLLERVPEELRRK
jgi:hypothetical protein